MLREQQIPNHAHNAFMFSCKIESISVKNPLPFFCPSLRPWFVRTPSILRRWDFPHDQSQSLYHTHNFLSSWYGLTPSVIPTPTLLTLFSSPLSVLYITDKTFLFLKSHLELFSPPVISTFLFPSPADAVFTYLFIISPLTLQPTAILAPLPVSHLTLTFLFGLMKGFFFPPSSKMCIFFLQHILYLRNIILF